jgi:hypothetical protein
MEFNDNHSQSSSQSTLVVNDWSRDITCVKKQIKPPV